MNHIIAMARQLQNLNNYHIVLIILATVFDTLELGTSVVQSEFDKHMECLLNMVQQKLASLIDNYGLKEVLGKVKKIVNIADFGKRNVGLGPVNAASLSIPNPVVITTK